MVTILSVMSLSSSLFVCCIETSIFFFVSVFFLPSGVGSVYIVQRCTFQNKINYVLNYYLIYSGHFSLSGLSSDKCVGQ